MSLLLLVALAAAAPDAYPPVVFQHGDWDLACDNTGTCRAAGYHAGEDTGGLVSVLLTRAAGPSQPVTAEVQLGDLDTPPAQVELHIDRRGLGAIALHDGLGTLAPAQVDALVAALRRDSDIAFLVAADGWFLSDDGAAAVLLKMDEAQGRLDTPGALVRRGKRSEASVPPPKAAPTLVAVPVPTSPPDAALASNPALRRAMEAVLPRDGCDPADARIDAAPEFEVHRLSADKLLVSTTCWLAAYNAGSGYWVVDAAPPYASTLVTTDGSAYADGEITSDQKGRGIGDCWSHEAWRWDGEAFVLAHRASAGQCKGFLGGAWSQPTYVTGP
jgi:hypothetical protein